MEIYLLRHGEAVEAEKGDYPNDDRPLTAKGRKRLKESADAYASLIDTPQVILSSPLIRAKHTAEIVINAMPESKRIRICDRLKPNGNANVLLKHVVQYKHKKSMLLVGHEPLLTSFAALLLQVRDCPFELKKGALACIEVESLISPLPGVVRLLITPRHFKELS